MIGMEAMSGASNKQKGTVPLMKTELYSPKS